MADAELMDFLTVEQEAPAEETAPPEETAEGEEQETTEAKVAPASLFQADGKKLDPAVKAGLAELKAKSPEVAKLVTRALYKSAELEREFPGGLTEARELRDKLDGLGGLAAVETKLADLEFFDGIDKKFTSGDPGFVDELANADSAAFAKIAPAVFAKFNEVSPEGWKQYIGNVVYGDFRHHDMPGQMTRLADALGRNDKAVAVESFNAIAAYLSSFKELAEIKVPEIQAKVKEQPKQQDDREKSLRTREWKLEHDGVERKIVQGAYASAIGSRKPSTEEQAQIKELFLSKRMSLGRQYFPDSAAKFEKLLQANDKAAAMRLAAQIHNRVVPEAMRWAVSRTLKGTAEAKPAAPAPKRNVSRETSQPATNGTFKPVAQEPNTWEIDYDQTTQGMLRNNTAVMKNGARVSWRDRG